MLNIYDVAVPAAAALADAACRFGNAEEYLVMVPSMAAVTAVPIPAA